MEKCRKMVDYAHVMLQWSEKLYTELPTILLHHSIVNLSSWLMHHRNADKLLLKLYFLTYYFLFTNCFILCDFHIVIFFKLFYFWVSNNKNDPFPEEITGLFHVLKCGYCCRLQSRLIF